MARSSLPAWIVSVINFKGGTGKSTVAIAIAETLCFHLGKRVAIVDSDFQCSASLALLGRRHLDELTYKERTLDHWVNRGLTDAAFGDLADIAVEPGCSIREADGLIHLVPSNPSMPRIERGILSNFLANGDIEAAYERASINIAASLRRLLREFDFVIIDCPPGLTLFSDAAIRAADGIVVPSLPNDISLAAVDHLRADIARVRTDWTFDQLLVGTVISKMRHRNASDHYRYQTMSVERLLDRVAPSFRILRPYLPYCRELESAGWRDLEVAKLGFADRYGDVAGKVYQLTQEFARSCRAMEQSRQRNARPASATMPLAKAG